MDDEAILDLLSSDQNRGLCALNAKYGQLCHTLAVRILHNDQDAEECVNDTLLAVAERIPPGRPAYLQAYVCRIVKNLALNRLAYRDAEKRSERGTVPLSDLEERLSETAKPETGETQELKRAINAFLRAQSEINRKLFIRRYWYEEPVTETAKAFGMNPNQVSARLFRTKEKLRKYLKKEGLIHE
ncbi:MAG: sigma-70 family RNA polymerase sigma factor [Clostridia bacterium]|nr:sigma-70 family RNA polymerase sigma factor [Clostridia bacterium]